MLFKSIRFKIVLWYMFILSVTLFVFSLVLYHNFSHKLKRDMDDVLRIRAEGIVDSIDAYWQAEWNAIVDKSQSRASEKANNINFFKITQRWINEKKADPSFIDYSIQIFDARGHLIASSKHIQSAGVPKFIFNQVINGKSAYDNWHVDLAPGKPAVLRRFTTSVFEKGHVAYLVQVASSLDSMHLALRHLIVLLAVLLPVTVLITGISGVFLAKLALNPVHQMIETIEQIKAENLKLRIDVPHTKDELNELAVTFNDMIARLDQSFASQQQFMQDISHELKTPLAILKGELEVTLKRARSAAEYETILLSSLEEVNRLVRIVDNLLMLARFDTKTFVLTPEVFDLTTLVKACIEDIRVLAEQKNIDVLFTQETVLNYEGDRGQIKRLILNLLDNAVKYTSISGKIIIDLWREKEGIKMEISDNGIGIPQQDLPHIFDRFYRVDKARGAGGFGLGLSIVKSIVQAHEGTIDVKTMPERGTVFIIFLPHKNP